jgi:acetyltransferase-like isoleucine patch superfamily enzyme
MFRFLLLIPFFKDLKQRDLLSKQARRQYFLYRFFRFFFSLNKEANFAINFTSIVLKPENIQLGRAVEKSLLISGNCYFQAINGIRIGDNTIIAPGVKIISSDHDFKNLNNHTLEDPIIIGSQCWIGANAVILPGVSIGNNTIVAAGAIVTKSFSEGDQVLKGVPAKAYPRK